MIGNGGLSVTALQRYTERDIAENGLWSEQAMIETALGHVLCALVDDSTTSFSHPFVMCEPLANFNVCRDGTCLEMCDGERRGILRAPWHA